MNNKTITEVRGMQQGKELSSRGRQMKRQEENSNLSPQRGKQEGLRGSKGKFACQGRAIDSKSDRGSEWFEVEGRSPGFLSHFWGAKASKKASPVSGDVLEPEVLPSCYLYIRPVSWFLQNTGILPFNHSSIALLSIIIFSGTDLCLQKQINYDYTKTPKAFTRINNKVSTFYP